MIRILKMTPVEWLEMDFKESYDCDQSVQDVFNKAKQWEFEIMDEFGKFIDDKKFIYNDENKYWESKYHTWKYEKLSELYKYFLRERSKYNG